MTSTTRTVTLADLEHRALDAHRANTPWSAFWPAVRPDVLTLVGIDRRRFRKVYGVLLSTVVAGNLDGAEPPGSWPDDDEQPPDMGVGPSSGRCASCSPARARFDETVRPTFDQGVGK